MKCYGCGDLLHGILLRDVLLQDGTRAGASTARPISTRHQPGGPRRQDSRRGRAGRPQRTGRLSQGLRLPRSAAAKEPMTVDTIFDIASLTKIVATTSGMMKLFDRARSGSTIRSPRICPNSRAAKPDHGARSDDALLRLAAGSGSGTAVERLRNRHSAGR